MSAETGTDARYIVVDGRRWRATDPHIPERLRAELVAELMAARRAVKASRAEPDELAAARARVHAAKVALGERGEPWWANRSEEALRVRAEAAIVALLNKRGPDSSICPSDAARISASPDWRPAMPVVREVAFALAADGRVVVTAGNHAVADPADARGPLRLRLPPADR